MKAVKVDETNKGNLELQFNMDDGYLDDAAGLYLVADFGEDAVYHGLLTAKGLERSFTETGKKLQNGFFEIARKNN